MKLLLAFALFAVCAAVWAQPVTQRIDHLPERKIIVTAVEFEVEKTFTCDVYYWHPDDVNQDGKIESCRDIAYDPCDALDGQLKLVQWVMGGGSCDEPEEIQCDFSPKDPRCP